MGYLITQMLLCLLIAFLLGLLAGWLLKSLFFGRRLDQMEREWQDRVNRCRADGRKLKARADTLEADLEHERERWVKERKALEQQAEDAMAHGRRDIEGLEAQLAERDEQVTAGAHQLASLEAELSGRGERLSRADDEIKTLQGRLEGAERDLADRTADADKARAEGSEQSDRVATLTASLAALQQKLDAGHGEQDSRFAALEEQWKSRYESARAASAEELAGRDQRIAELEAKLERSRGDSASRIAELEVALDECRRDSAGGEELETLRKEVQLLKSSAGRAVPAEKDDLKKIYGIGPVLERLLNGLGIQSFRQIAAWDDADIAWAAAKLEDFPDRIKRDDWIAGAKLEHRKKYDEEI
ncbi:MAG: hypothetical protein AAF604_23485 [Acidobacteriota bacterium]